MRETRTEGTREKNEEKNESTKEIGRKKQKEGESV